MPLPLRLLDVCRSRDVSLSELARWSGIARVSLSRYAHGTQDITLTQLLKIAAALGCTISDLVEDRENLISPEWQKAIRRRASDRAHRRDKSWVPRALLAGRAAFISKSGRPVPPLDEKA
jgi:DNA-binding Xre family transcriptional regulator